MTVTAQPDVIAAVRGYLLADADVLELSAGRVYGVQIPPANIGAMPTATVVVKRAGGPGDASRIPWSRSRIDVFCYAATPSLAATLELAVFQALKLLDTALIGNAKLFDAIILTGPIDLREPDTGWPSVIRSYLVSMNEGAQV